VPNRLCAQLAHATFAALRVPIPIADSSKRVMARMPLRRSATALASISKKTCRLFPSGLDDLRSVAARHGALLDRYEPRLLMPPSSDVRGDLLLAPGSSCGFSDGPVGGALGRERPTILSLCGRKRLRVHFASMGLSYTLMLSAFYVENGKHLPLWAEYPSGLSGSCRSQSARQSSST
jgi:hypothetical protein